MSGTMTQRDFGRPQTFHVRCTEDGSTLLPAGSLLANRYRILSRLGKGGFGSVYHAHCMATGEHVALKLLHSPSSRRSVHFRREASLLQRLSHPSLVEVLDFGWCERGPFIVFELLVGSSLSERLRRRETFSTRRTVHVALQILTGLSVAHSRGIVHRDIKPANVFVCETPRSDHVKVLDFGLAKLLADDDGAATRFTQVGEWVGTPAYMAPEQLRSGVVGPRADLYAVGLVMAEMIGGKRVFAQKNVLDLVQAKLSDVTPDLSSDVLNSPLAGVIARALGCRPLQRFANAAAMGAAVLLASAPHELHAVDSVPHRGEMALGPALTPVSLTH